MRRQFPEQHVAWLPDVFKGLDPKSRDTLQEAGEFRDLEEGDRLDTLRECIVRVESGMLKLAVTSEDRSLTVWLFGPDDTVILPLFHTWEPGLYYLQAQEECEIRIIPQSAVLKAAAGSPEFQRTLMQQLSWMTWQLMNTVHMLAFYNLPQRVAQVLVNLATMFGFPNAKGGIRLGIRFTQEELAEMAGARRETLSTVLQEFREDDVLDLRYARIDIKDLEALKRIAGAQAVPFLEPNKKLSRL
jgi:CRP-like cAMP-binding protein